MKQVLRKPSAAEVAQRLSEIQCIPLCEDCELLRGANLLAQKHFGKKHEMLFAANLAGILTTHVDLNCADCPVDQVMKSLRKDRFAAIAAMF